MNKQEFKVVVVKQGGDSEVLLASLKENWCIYSSNVMHGFSEAYMGEIHYVLFRDS